MQMISVNPDRLKTFGEIHQRGSSHSVSHYLGFEKFPAEQVALSKHRLKIPSAPSMASGSCRILLTSV